MAVYLGNEMVSSGGGIGGGSIGSGAETFKIIFYNANISGTVFKSTKTFSELKDAIEKGLIIEGEYKRAINNVEVNKLWLTSILSNDGSEITGTEFFYLESAAGEMYLYNISFFSDGSIDHSYIKLNAVSN